MAPGKAKAPSFTEFAASNGLRVRGRCVVCSLPEDVKVEINNAWATGYRAVAVRRYLAALGHDHVTVALIHNHFGRGHHEGGAG